MQGDTHGEGRTVTVGTDVVEDWLTAGQTATMLVTSAMQYPDATDPAYVSETGQLISGLRCGDMAITMAWLARLASTAILDKHNGSHEAAAGELQQLALVLAEARDGHGGYAT